MNWLTKILPTFNSTASKRVLPSGVWDKCQSCQAILYHSDLKKDLYVCSTCDHHHPIAARERIQALLDPGWEEIAGDIESKDILKFRKYKDRLHEARKKTNEKESIVVGQGTLHRQAVVIAAFEFQFIGGSLGAAAGEKFTRGAMAAIQAQCPYICFSASGGARMHEGLFSLFQMAKTSAALALLSEHRLPMISVLTHPTMGGVSASLAMLGDIIIAEPGALIGFAGPRVIEQTVREKLPEGFQQSEFLIQHGAIDAIVDRRHLKAWINEAIESLMFYRDRTNQTS